MCIYIDVLWNCFVYYFSSVWFCHCVHVRSLGGITSFFDVPEPEPLDGWSLMDILPGRRMVLIRPDAAPGRSKAILTWFGEHRR